MQLKEFFIKHWTERVCRYSTIVALIIIYLDIFHHVAVSELLHVVTNQLLPAIFNNEKFIDSCVVALIALLGFTKKF